ncbi:MAG: Ldh family oxidoreductase [Candidatus Latescibacterota bacterium]
MNRPPKESRRIPAEQLRRFCQACLEAAGLRADHAEQLARLLTNSDLRGVRSHGTRCVRGYAHSIREGHINPSPQLRVLQETATTVLVDGDGGLGYAPMMMATQMAITKAKMARVALGATVHIGHYGSAGHYVRRAMEEGCIALSVQGHQPGFSNRWHAGQQSAYFGNPPICFGFPNHDEPPMVLDAATCILADYQRGPEFDALQEMIPSAFFKSMGYTAAALLLGGAFVGANGHAAEEVSQKWRRVRQGGLIVVMDAGAFVPAAEVRQGADALVRGVREHMLPVRGYAEATLPGTIEHRHEADYARDGVPVGLEDLKGLEEMGQEFGVEPEWVAQAATRNHDG